MKKRLLGACSMVVTLLLITSTHLMGQNTLSYTEDFSVPVGANPPTGWTTSNPSGSTSANAFWKFGNWSGSFNYDTQGTTDNTGNNGQFAWVDGSTPYPEVCTLETKFFDFTNHWNLMLEFYHISYNVTYSSSGHNDFYIDFWDGAQWHSKVFSQKGNNPSAAWTKKMVDLTAYPPQGNEQVKFRFIVNKNAATPFYNDIGIDDFEVSGEEAMLGQNNAAAVGAAHETRCLGLQDVDVIISNRGRNQIDSVEVHWTVDGVAQPMYHHKSVMDTLTGQNPASAIVTLGQVNFAFGVPRTIKYWTSNPNGVADTVNDNDTSEFVQYAALSGTYTVGPDTSNDLPNLDTVAWLLNNVGICGPVTFELEDAVHVGKLWLDRVPGNGVQNTITFTSQGGNAANCTITDTTRNAVTNWIVILDTTEYVTFEDLTITNGSITSFSGVVDLRSTTRNVTFNNCHLFSAHVGSSADAYIIRSEEEHTNNNIELRNSTFEGGSWAIWMKGSRTSIQDNLEIVNCDFVNNHRSSVLLDYYSNVELNGNRLKSNSTNTGTAALNLNNVSGYFEAYGNHIFHGATWPQIGLRVQNTAGTSSKYNLIMNNTFSVGDTAGATTLKEGIYLSSVAFFDVKFNSVAVASGNTASTAFKIASSNGNIVHNNVFANMGAGGPAVDVSGLGSIITMDNNLLYSMNGDLGKFSGNNENDLSDWQLASGFDMNSVSEDPMFYGLDTLKICSKNADNIGQASGLVVDFLNTLRDPQTPDPGAYEYTAISGITVDNQQICEGDTAMFFVATGQNDVLIWNFTDTGNVYMTTQAGTYDLTAIGECGADTTSFTVGINDLVSLPNDTNICGGDTLHVTASIANGVYSWNDGQTGQTAMFTSNGQYYVNVVDSDGCFSSDTIEVTVSVGAVLRPDTTVCEGATVELDPGTSAGSYTWSRDGIIISTGSKIFADSAGQYSVIYVDPKNCSSNDTFNMSVDPLPRAGFTYTMNQNNVRFEADDKTGSFYYWSFGDGKSVSGPAYFTVNKYAANGSYSVSLRVSSENCGDSTGVQQLTLTTIGINDNEFAAGVSVYPNPSNGIINIDFLETKGAITVEVYAADGKIVFSEEGVENSGTQIDLQNKLSTGVYMLHLKSKDEVLYTGKIAIK